MLQVSIVLLGLSSVALAALSIGLLELKPDKFKDTPGCYITDLDDIIPFGELRPSKHHCMEYLCHRDEVVYATCGSVYVEPPCKAEFDKTLPYPGCCQPKVVCPEPEPAPQHDNSLVFNKI